MFTIGDIKSVDYYNAAPDSGIFTVLNITSTSGYLHKIQSYTSSAAGAKWPFHNYVIYIDGVYQGTPNLQWFAQWRGSSDYVPHLYTKARFKQSLRVEINTYNNYPVKCTVVYSEDQ